MPSSLAVATDQICRSCFPRQKILLAILLLITAVSVFLHIHNNSAVQQRITSLSESSKSNITFTALRKQDSKDITSLSSTRKSHLVNGKAQQNQTNGRQLSPRDGELNGKAQQNQTNDSKLSLRDKELNGKAQQNQTNGRKLSLRDKELNGKAQHNQTNGRKLSPRDEELKTLTQTRIDTTIESGNTTRSISNPSSSLTNSRPRTTHVTYNTSVEIHCFDSSPYILCSGRPAARSESDRAADSTRHQPWKISVARPMGWGPSADFSQCRYNNCVNAGSHSDADVVVFNAVGISDNFPRPPRKPGSTQRWAFMMWESPVHMWAKFTKNPESVWNREINMTMTYRVDTDIFVPYGFLAFEPQPVQKRPNYYEIARNKKKLAVWFVSNCHTPSRRMAYVKRMKKYIEVDIFGGCGTPCPENKPGCLNDLIAKYTFYLSFENSLCTDYVTEKFFKIFKNNTHVIPVTRGGANYTKYFAPNTFINAASFPSPRHLAEYLKRLASDHETLARMLEHKDMYKWYGGTFHRWCTMCESLNTKSITQKTINSKNWWSDGHCHRPKDIR